MGSLLHWLKTSIFFVVNALYLMPFFVTGVWLLGLVYFPSVDREESKSKAVASAGSGKQTAEVDMFRKIMQRDDSIGRGHFHMVDEHVTDLDPGPTLCVMCHGTYPHAKDEKRRSMLNLHVGFIDCAVCHIGEEEGHTVSFAWVDRHSGQIVPEVSGSFGRYPAKIFPVSTRGSGPPEIVRPVSEKAAKEYLEVRTLFTPDQNTEAKAMLHERVTKEAVSCSDCHTNDGYLDFRALGFSGMRSAHLESTEVVGLIEGKNQFFMPSFLE